MNFRIIHATPSVIDSVYIKNAVLENTNENFITNTSNTGPEMSLGNPLGTKILTIPAFTREQGNIGVLTGALTPLLNSVITILKDGLYELSFRVNTTTILLSGPGIARRYSITLFKNETPIDRVDNFDQLTEVTTKGSHLLTSLVELNVNDVIKLRGTLIQPNHSFTMNISMYSIIKIK